jgi:glyoxylase-like metal-dependent hydrolase (beta-lactamase superfamily II)/rhodanese-related sulfurtransferase
MLHKVKLIDINFEKNMKIKQIYTGCLAQGAYYIESNGEAAIIDPLREVDSYLELASKRNAKIKYIFETHFHADFVSGHVTLAEKTGAPIIYGPNANPNFDCIIAKDNEKFHLGNLAIKALHTPGHTMESTSYLLIDENDKDHAIFSGDTLFIGDVGRPDLAQKDVNTTQEELAAILFDSLRNKIMTLPNETIVYPAHGAGSACGKNMSKETISTIGEQKEDNYALRADMTKDEFIKEVTNGLFPPPDYFPLNVLLNKEGYENIEDVIKKSQNALNPTDFEDLANKSGAVVLDVRNQIEFAKEHIPRSIFIGLNGDFAPWVGALIKDVVQPILLVVSESNLKEAITRLSRVGFDNVIGYLEGGIESWKASKKQTDTINSITAIQFEELSKKTETEVFDVRKKSEYLSEHLIDSNNIPLVNINSQLSRLQTNKTNYIHCAGGYRSVIASSILKSIGIHNLVNIEGGFLALKNTSVQISNFTCPSTINQ